MKILKMPKKHLDLFASILPAFGELHAFTARDAPGNSLLHKHVNGYSCSFALGTLWWYTRPLLQSRRQT